MYSSALELLLEDVGLQRSASLVNVACISKPNFCKYVYRITYHPWGVPSFDLLNCGCLFLALHSPMFRRGATQGGQHKVRFILKLGRVRQGTPTPLFLDILESTV
jgi:hypothetical protein